MKKMNLIKITIATLGLIACHAQTENTKLEGPHEGVFGGQLAEEDPELSQHVVGLYHNKEDEYYICSGSLIADDLILTAAHCVPADPKNLIVVFSSKMSKETLTNHQFAAHVEKALVHHGYDPNSESASNLNDIAILKFNGGIRNNYKPILLSDDMKKFVDKKTTLRVAGYGIANRNDQSGSGELRWTDLSSAKYFSDTEFVVPQIFTGVCSGDSGGPATVKTEKGYVQVGVTSRGTQIDGYCILFGVFTKVDSYLDWMKTSTKALRESK